MRSKRSQLSKSFDAFRPALLLVALLSVLCNLLLFVGPLYMLQIYDRVLSSRSVETLIALTIIAAFLLFTYGLLDFTRNRILNRAGAKFDKDINGGLFRTALKSALATRSTQSQQALRDMETVRDFWTGPTVITLCDAPFAPVFIAVCFLFHPYLGVVALIGSLILFVLALLNEWSTRKSIIEAGRASIGAQHYANASFRNAEVIHALGMQKAIHSQWANQHSDALGWSAQASDRSGLIGSTSKFVRSFLQVAILGAGAFLAIQGEISAGVMIAASIMMGRALQPVEQAVAQWKSLTSARSSWSRLKALFDDIPEEAERIKLPEPKGELKLEGVITGAPGQREPILKGISFELAAGDSLAVIGPSAAGKSTLARVMVGVWPAMKGCVRLDGADLRHWNSEDLGQHIGYLPQDVELFGGTVASNIARCTEPDSAAVVAAAELAGTHQLIQSLPNGYDTQIGEMGMTLSGGQRQRIGLARAVYGQPKILVLDEPNAHLDSGGESDLARAIRRISERGTTIVIITHRPALLNEVNKVAVMANGELKAFGPSKEVMKELASLRVVPGGEGRKGRPGGDAASRPSPASAQPPTQPTNITIGQTQPPT